LKEQSYDIFDECDISLNSNYQFIYAVGLQQELIGDDGEFRWRAGEMLLNSIRNPYIESEGTSKLCDFLLKNVRRMSIDI
jgi:hypothetical protein